MRQLKQALQDVVFIFFPLFLLTFYWKIHTIHFFCETNVHEYAYFTLGS